MASLASYQIGAPQPVNAKSARGVLATTVVRGRDAAYPDFFFISIRLALTNFFTKLTGIAWSAGKLAIAVVVL